MKLKKNLLLCLLFCSLSYAQIKFEPGYFINAENNKINCLIKNNDWEASPTKVQYKLSENSEVLELNVTNCKEFYINNYYKFISIDIAVDQSPDDANKLSYQKEPLFVNEKIFLKVLVSGDANLYVYMKTNQYRYFYSTQNSDITQLIFKKYLRSENDITVRRNSQYVRQLFKDVNCNTLSIEQIERTEYVERDLIKYFEKHNQCKGNSDDLSTKVSNSIAQVSNSTAEVKKSKGSFNIKGLIGMNQSKLNINNFDGNGKNVNFDKETSIVLGVEFEYILPINRNKWSLVSEINRSSYKSKGLYNYKTLSIDETEYVNAKTSSTELSLAFRHYLFLNENSKLFLNLAVFSSFRNTPAIESQINPNLKLNKFSSQTTEVVFGFGYQYKSFSTELRFYPARDIDDYVVKESKLSKMSLLLKYKLF